jgi:MFS family permease
MKDGFAFVWSEPGIRAFAIGAGVINLAFTAVAAVLVLHAQDNLGLDEVGFGLLLGAAAVGGIVGAIVAPPIVRLLRRYRSILFAVATMAAGMVVAGVAQTPWIAGAGLALFAMAGGLWDIVSVTYRQTVTPDALLGRVMSGFRVIAYGTFPLGAAVGGVIAALLSLRATFYFGAFLTAALIPLLQILLPRHSLDQVAKQPEERKRS